MTLRAPTLFHLVCLSWAIGGVLCGSAFAQVDHRHAQSRVKDQGARGTCAAFAVCAAMETFPGVPSDLSEQMLYASIKLFSHNIDRARVGMGGDEQMQAGDTLETYSRLMSDLGTCAESFFPYNPNPGVVPPDAPELVRRYVAMAHAEPQVVQRLREEMGTFRLREDGMTYLVGPQAGDVERLKRELDTRLAIPVAYHLHTASWVQLDRLGEMVGDRRDVIHPGMMDRFALEGGEPLTYHAAKVEAMRRGMPLVDAVRRGEFQRVPVFSEGYGGHAVTIVGYDAAGFIVKNSWGERWGTGGYARVSFDYHALYASEAVLIDNVRIMTGIAGGAERTPRIRDARWRLKVQPMMWNNKPTWGLSTWAFEPQQPDYDGVEYTVEVRDRSGRWSVLERREVRTGDHEWRRGAALLLPPAMFERIAESHGVRVTLRHGYLRPSGAIAGEAMHYLTRHVFTPDLAIKHAVDVAPTR